MKAVAGVIAAFFAVLFFLTACSTWYTIDQGERGVLLTNGAIQAEVGPGMHFKTPMFQSIEKISIQNQTRTYDKLNAYSKDQQPATLKVSVTFRINDPSKAYANFGGYDGIVLRVLDPRVPTFVENVFGQYDAISAVQERTKLVAQLTSVVAQALADAPITIDSVQIENIDFSDAYEHAVESRMQAIVAQQQAEAGKQKRIIDADAAAYEVRVNADAYAHQTIVQGDAQATAIKARGEALRNSPNLVELTAVEKWNGALPSTMIPGQTVPFLGVK